ncbi:MAG: TolC family protein, partial [Gemmatimonadales bacterium]
MHRTLFGVAVLCVSGAPLGRAAAQQTATVTREQAIAGALAHNPRLAAARADTQVASAKITTAGAPADPTLSAGYSKDIPQYHVTLALPLGDFLLVPARVRAARAGQRASRYRQRFEIAAVALDADTTYTRALATLARARLSTRNAQDADSLRRMVVARRDAGAASDMDVELAMLVAGQQANAAAADSVAARATLLALQSVMGIGPAGVVVTPVDSLDAPAGIADLAIAPPPAEATLRVAGSAAALQSAVLYTQVQHRYLVGALGVNAGFDTG